MSVSVIHPCTKLCKEGSLPVIIITVFLLVPNWPGLTGLAEAAVFPLLCSTSSLFPACLRMRKKFSFAQQILVIKHKMREKLAPQPYLFLEETEFYCRREPGRVNPKRRKASNIIIHISLPSRGA